MSDVVFEYTSHGTANKDGTQLEHTNRITLDRDEDGCVVYSRTYLPGKGEEPRESAVPIEGTFPADATSRQIAEKIHFGCTGRVDNYLNTGNLHREVVKFLGEEDKKEATLDDPPTTPSLESLGPPIIQFPEIEPMKDESILNASFVANLAEQHLTEGWEVSYRQPRGGGDAYAVTIKSPYGEGESLPGIQTVGQLRVVMKHMCVKGFAVFATDVRHTHESRLFLGVGHVIEDTFAIIDAHLSEVEDHVRLSAEHKEQLRAMKQTQSNSEEPVYHMFEGEFLLEPTFTYRGLRVSPTKG